MEILDIVSLTFTKSFNSVSHTVICTKQFTFEIDIVTRFLFKQFGVAITPHGEAVVFHMDLPLNHLPCTSLILLTMPAYDVKLINPRPCIFLRLDLSNISPNGALPKVILL